MTINETQSLYLELIRRSSFNNFDGNAVAKDLELHQDKWRSVMMIGLGSLIALRDLPQGHNNVDTMYVLCGSELEIKDMERLAHKWGADEIDQLSAQEAGGLLGQYGFGGQYLLRIWWD